MFKLSLLASLLASLASASASGTTIADFGFPIVSPAPEVRANTCKAFNDKVTAVNDYIRNNNLSTELLSTNLCTYISISEGQLESTLNFDHIYIYNDVNSWIETLHEEVAVAREIELIVLAQPGNTQYLYYSGAEALLENQYFEFGFSNINPNPTGVLYNLWGAGLTAGVFNRSSNAIYANSANCSGRDTSVSCVPGGSSNSRYWILDRQSPLSSTENATVFQTESSSVGFNIGLTGGVSEMGPSASLSAGFSVGYSRSDGRERKAVNVVAVKQSNDSGVKATWSLTPAVVAAAPTMGATSYAIADANLGSSAYRELDLSAEGSWREIVGEANCTPGTNRSIKFTSDLYIERGAYDLEGTGGDARWDYSSDSVIEGKNLSHTMAIQTQCQRDNQGNLIRVALSGLLNQ